MIKLSRRPAPPNFFESAEFKNFKEQLRGFHRTGGTRKTQRSFSWQRHFEPFLSEAIAAMFAYQNGKCAYSEAGLSDEHGIMLSHAQLVLHRPASDAVGLDGDVSPDHYWWLIPEWTNWYLASGSIASVKENRFPIAPGTERLPAPHASRSSTADAVEQSLLLDPCEDDPVWYLQFWRTGLVGACDIERGRSYASRRLPYDVPHKGIHTVRTLDLNNETLVTERRKVIGSMSRSLQAAVQGERDAFVASIRDADLHPFTAAVRGAAALMLLTLLDVNTAKSKAMDPVLAQSLIAELPAEIAVSVLCNPNRPRTYTAPTIELFDPVGELLQQKFGPKVRTRFLAELGVREAGTRRPARADPQADEEDDSRPVIDRSAHIKGILIRNFKAIREAELDTEDLGEDERTVTLEKAWRADDESDIRNARRWWAFLGENGSGKSSVLQAIGLALAGENIGKVMQDSKLDWSKLLRRPPRGATEKVHQGRICLDFSNGVRIDLRFNANKHWWVGGEPEMQTFIRGYGATRLLESKDGLFGTSFKRTTPDSVNIANLFDPRATVIDAERWLVELSEDDFNVAAPTIAGLIQDRSLGMDSVPTHNVPVTSTSSGDGTSDAPDPTLSRSTDGIRILGQPLELVSDGYRAIVAMLSDIMAGLGTGLSTMGEAPGIVLIDEIGAHLHPRWRMAITRKLRRALPRVQFIVSTHEPLCLRGLVAKEVIRVHKHLKHGVITEVVERSPSNYRVDQLLTSEFFGLETTIDPDLERRFHHYYRLLAVPETERDEKQNQDLQDLYRYLHKHAKPSFGFTRRDQLVCEQIDLLLSEEFKSEPPDETQQQYVERRRTRRRETIAKVRDIWEMRSAPYDLGTPQ